MDFLHYVVHICDFGMLRVKTLTGHSSLVNRGFNQFFFSLSMSERLVMYDV